MSKGWIGVDLDGTLAQYDGWRGKEHIGAPVPAMMERVKQWITEGQEVRIFTARADDPANLPFILAWLYCHDLEGVPVTNIKDFGMIELWDDRCVAVEPNTGRALNPSRRGL